MISASQAGHFERSLRRSACALAAVFALARPVAAQSLPTWDRAVTPIAAVARPTGRLIGTNLGYGPCGPGITVPDSVTIVGLAAGADSVGATARIDAEGSEQWSFLALPTDPSFAMPMAVVGVRCRNAIPAQLFVQRGTAFAVAFVDHAAALGANGFVRARRGGANLALMWRPSGRGGALAP
jgi:hypothetical protein